MPCFLTCCDAQHEGLRFAVSIIAIYVYHNLWDDYLITPITLALHRTNSIPYVKIDKMRECMWKVVAITTFLLLGWRAAGKHSWWMKSTEYYSDWPQEMPEDLRWYYMLYFSFWVQSVDFLFNITGKRYAVSRKDNLAMFVHHLTAMMLMFATYFLDHTRVTCCMLMLHDVSDLILETG